MASYHESATTSVAFNPYLPAIGRVLEVLRSYGPGATIEINNRDLASAAGCSPGRIPALLRKQIKGANMPAPRAILAAAIEGAYVDVDTADEIETRYFVSLVTGQVAQNMIKAFFFDLQHINGGGSRPKGFDKYTPKKVGVIGAGMMGAAIAYGTAKAGIDVVLKDINIDNKAFGSYRQKMDAKLFSKYNFI